MSARVRWKCVGCEARLEASPEETPTACPRCGEAVSWQPSEEVKAGRRPDLCAICGRRELYREKSVNRAVGLGIVIAAACLAPFTWYISLAVAALIDMIAYAWLPERVVCYLCRAEYRGFADIGAIENFDLHVAQVMTRYTWPPKAAEKHA